MKKTPSLYLFGILIISMATLLLELALTRVLSVSLWYHFGFLVISMALLGFGAAGVTLSVSKSRLLNNPLDILLTNFSAAFAVSVVVCFWIMQRIPFDPFSLLSNRMQFLYMPLYFLVTIAPFYFSGIVIGLLLTRVDSGVNQLYAFDLLGAGVGCGAIAIFMPALGGPGTVVASAALGAMATVLFSINTARRLIVLSVGLVMMLTGLVFIADRALPITITANKGTAFRDVKPVYSAWNTFSKVDLYRIPEDTVKHSPGQLVFLIDGGTALTRIATLDKGVDAVLSDIRKDSVRRDITELRVEVAALDMQRPKILIIGSGAGDEVLEGVMLGAASITAVELNPLIIQVCTGVLAPLWGGLFQRPEVKLVQDEGRSFVKRSDETFDIILSSHTISNAAVASGALSLSENYVLTKEAFQDYLEHLSADGVLFFTRPEIQLPRLFTTATEVLRANGIESPADHMYAYARTSLRDKHETHKFMGGFLLKKSPLTQAEVTRIKLLLQPEGDSAALAAITELYNPFSPPNGALYEKIVKSNDLQSLYNSNELLLEPATDDKPFFNQRNRWSRITWQHFNEIFTQDNRARLALEDKPIAEITLLLILVQAVIIAALLILIPLRKNKVTGVRRQSTWRYLLYFAGLGAGFILIEIAFLQRFNLYLGQPVHTYAVVLSGLLIFTGCGSYLSSYLQASRQTILSRVLPVIILLLALSAVLIPRVFELTLHLSQPARVIIALMLIAPLAVSLGLPFPIGLIIIRRELPTLAPWAWGVNGFFTVIGSVCAVIMGMAFGFTIVLITASICYITGCVCFGLLGTDGSFGTKYSKSEKIHQPQKVDSVNL